MGHLTYLLLELGWALPVIAGQWALGHRVLRARRRLLLVAVLLPTLYLSLADALAIRVGIWTLNPELTLGLHIGALPLEEAVFFLLTNVMVVQGLLLMLDPGAVTGRLRARGRRGGSGRSDQAPEQQGSTTPGGEGGSEARPDRNPGISR